MNGELLFNKIYEGTKNFSRVDFVKLLMLKENENKKLKQNISYYLDWLEKEVHNYKSSLFNHAIAYRNSYSILVLGDKINIFDKGDKNAERVCF